MVRALCTVAGRWWSLLLLSLLLSAARGERDRWAPEGRLCSGSPLCSAQDGSSSGFHYSQYRCEKRGGGGRLGRGACGSHDEDHDHDDHWNPPPEYPLLVRWSGGWRTGQVSSNSMCEIQVPPGRALRLGVTGPPGGWPCSALPVSQIGFSFKVSRRRGVLKSGHVTGTRQRSRHSVDWPRA